MSKIVPSITISQAEQSKSSSVWALNGSGVKGQQKGNINITVTEGNGRANNIVLPVTFIPIDLTTQATKNAVLSSPDFRRMVQRQFVRLISEEDATLLLSTQEAQAEQRRIFDLGTAELDAIHAEAPAEVKSLLAENNGTVGGYAMNLAHNKDGNEDELVSNLRNNIESLSTEELQYIVNNSSFPRVKALAAEHAVS